MGCDELKKIKVTKGESGIVVDIYLTNSNTCRPYDLSSATEITVKFKAVPTLIKLLTTLGVSIVGAPELGHIQVTLTAANINTLNEGNGQDILIWVSEGPSVLKKTLLKGLLDVLKEPFT